MRRLLRDIGEGRELGDVTTLRDPDVVSKLDDIVKQRAADDEAELSRAAPRGGACRSRVRGSSSANSTIRGNL